MAIMGCNLEEVKQFQNEIGKLKRKLKYDIKYRNDIMNHGNNYNYIKEFFQKYSMFLKYTETADIDCFYRIRKNHTLEPFTTRKELLYPEPSIKHKDRMNNTNFRVLYVSLNEYTAMAETRIDNNYIGGFFQLTRFSTTTPLTVYKLGMFSELYLNNPRDSKYVKEKTKDIFGSEGYDNTIQGFSALECALSDILYSTDENSHILSSILADAIFTVNPNIDAIMYPSMQNRYGINLAIKKEYADLLNITYSSLNILKEVYQNGFYKYYTKMDCENFDNEDNFKFNSVDGNATFR
jgi:hypothetical protein